VLDKEELGVIKAIEIALEGSITINNAESIIETETKSKNLKVLANV
jgi:hypothetical protein